MFKTIIQKMKRQMGFTLIEMLIAILISGIVGIGAVTAVYQIADSSRDSNNHLVATKQAENAVYNISVDAAMNQETVMTGSGLHFITFKWTNWVDARYTVVSYSIDASGQLTRTQKVYRRKQVYSTGGSPESTQTSLIARYVDPSSAQTYCGGLTSGLLTFQITVNIPGTHPVIEVRRFQVTCRSM
jgi:prepilin-type N-terminal cleavage/methylation domain-containing protein